MWRNTSYIEMCTMWLDETIHNNKFSSSPTLFLENYPLMISKAYRPGFSTFNHLQIIRVATAGVGNKFTVCSNEAAAAKWADTTPYCCIRTASNVFALQNMSHLWGNQTLCLHMEPQEHDPYNIKNSWSLQVAVGSNSVHVESCESERGDGKGMSECEAVCRVKYSESYNLVLLIYHGGTMYPSGPI
ncbi:hypothetical protein F2Q69_00012142 [Brassica cretica]|uniref:Uncharacterized protein n=1 Tax=Brassica cretica TaxID=69181 RepID=A0A8S9R4J5_BRACR|nr:hypothetical protein F2Q69_00012142 [Brassica cretica]